MKLKLLLTIGILLCATLAYAGSDDTAFTYQGLLDEAGNPANGTYDFQFALYDAATNGNLVAGFATNSAVAVSNGLFTTTLDFGNVFNGAPCWLNLAVRTNATAGAFVSLRPRQPILPAPLALYSLTAGTASNANSIAATNIVGLSASQLTNGIVPLSVLPAAVVTNNFTGTLNGSNAMQLLFLPDQTIYPLSLVLGNGGTALNPGGVNPADPDPLFPAENSQGNTFVGIDAGISDTTGAQNTFLGSQAGQNNINGTQNVFLGQQAGIYNTSGYHNVFIGEDAGQDNTTGYWNVFVGTDAGISALNGNWNVFIGTSCGGTNTGNANCFIGVNSGNSQTSGTQDMFLGFEAGLFNTVGSYNVGLGVNSGQGNINGSNNVWIGTSCGTFAGAHGLQNTFVGSSCAYSNGGSYNSFLGANAGVCNTTGSNNTFVGFVSGEFSTSCQDDTLIGSHAGENTTTGGANVAVGYSSSQANTTGENNTALGAYALNANSSSSDNTAVGYGALLSSTGANNIGIGYKAGANLTLSTSSNNIYIFAALQNGLVDESNVTRIGELQTACYLAGTVISSNGFASFLTNVLSPAANAWSTRSSTLNSGWTNNLGTNMVANVSGTSGSVIFWNRGGPGGGTSAANPLWTNTVPYNFAVGANCGFQVVNGSGVYAQVYAP